MSVQAAHRLDSWKEIAAYFGRSERTVRRWEENEELPVHRLQHEKRGSVYAYASELDGWREARESEVEPEATVGEERPPEIEPSPNRPGGRWLWLLATGGGLLLVVAVLLGMKLLRGETQPIEARLSAHPPVNPEAHQAYVKGRYLRTVSGEPALKKSREYFEQAIWKDPGYAQAWSGLADTYNRLASWGVLPSEDARPRARVPPLKKL